jgi:hypothetical protein
MTFHLQFDSNPSQNICESDFDIETNPHVEDWIQYEKSATTLCEKCLQISSEHAEYKNARLIKARDMMDILEIDYRGLGVSIVDLYDIFSDDHKIKEICSKLKLKMFW